MGLLMRSTIIETGQVLSERECLWAIAPRQWTSSKSACSDYILSLWKGFQQRNTTCFFTIQSVFYCVQPNLDQQKELRSPVVKAAV